MLPRPFPRFSILSLLLCSVFAVTSAASAQVSFTASSQYGTSAFVNQIVSADFNHDGFADMAYIAQTGDGLQGNHVVSYLIVRLNDGHGAFGSEQVYNVATGSSPSYLMVGDFNGDGVLDIVVNAGAATNDVRFFFGNGNGTFRGGLDVAVAGPPQSIAVGDFNNDGKIDVATLISPPYPPNPGDPAGTLDILLSNGDGTFTHRVQTIPGGYWTGVYNDPTYQDVAASLVAGDWNGDGKIDLAYIAGCPQCYVQDAVIQMFNDGQSFHRASSAAAQGTGTGLLRSADIDLDGRSDIYYFFNGCHTPCTGVNVLYSNGDGTAVLKSVFAGGSTDANATDLIVGDFDNDGVIDIAAANGPGTDFSTNPATNFPSGVTIFRGLGGRNFASAQRFPLTGPSDAANSYGGNIAAGLVNGDGRTDLILATGYYVGNTSTAAGVETVFLNTSSGGSCLYPTGASGVNLCAPADGASASGNTQIFATGKGVSNPIQRMEVWIDGAKTFQVFNDEVNTTLNLSSGPHSIAINAVDFAGQVVTSTVTVNGSGGGSCSATTNTVRFCAPQQGATSGSPVTVTASANLPGFTLNRLYVDNVAVYETANANFTQAVPMSAGAHHLVIVAYNNQGGALADSRDITVSSGGGGGGCATPAAGTVQFCAPQQGATTTDPVTVSAAENLAGNTAMRLYVDNAAVYETGNTSFAQSLTLGTGAHNLVVVAYNNQGGAVTDSRSVTVSGGTSCGTPANQTVVVCIPTEGSTAPSPVEISATARYDGTTITHMRVYVDDQPAADQDYPAGGHIDVSVPLGSGSHRIVVVAWNQFGAAIASPTRTITVP